MSKQNHEPKKLKRKAYEEELERLEIELVKQRFIADWPADIRPE